MSQEDVMFWTAILIILVVTLVMVLLLVWAESSLNKRPKKPSFIARMGRDEEVDEE